MNDAAAAHGDRAAATVPDRRDLRRQAAWTAVGLSILFLVVYEGTSWITSHRSDVGTWVYAWERWIPFVPLMIVPYVSIDLLFVAGPFLCADRKELRTLRRRVALAILVAGACFLLMPLRLGHPRPQVEGWLEPVFSALHSFDRPYNLCPSLHIALRTILAALYARHTIGGWRVLSHVWFSLIGFSTLLIGQHHVIDVVGGFVLAAFCFWIVSPAPWWTRSAGNLRVGVWYGAGAVCCAAGALLLAGRGGWVLWWPALVLGLVSMAYALGPRGPGAAIYRKHDGQVPLASRVLLAPVLLGQWLSWHWYRPHGAPWNEIAPNLWIGRVLTASEAREARRQGLAAVLDLTAEFSESPVLRGLPSLNVPLLDLTAPTLEEIDRCRDFIDRHLQRGPVLVHCKAGFSRSAAVVGSWLLASGAADGPDDAMRRMRQARPGLVVRPEAREAIERAALDTILAAMGPVTRTTTALLEGLVDPANEEAWRSFDERYRPILVGFATRLGLEHADACDVAQETLLRFIGEFRDGRYDRQRGRLRSWLIAMASSKAATMRRWKAGRREHRGESAIVDLADAEAMDAAWEQERRRAILGKALEEMRRTGRTDPRTIQAFEMLFSHGLAPTTVAAELGMGVHDVYLAKSRVAARLREIMSRLEGEFEGES